MSPELTAMLWGGVSGLAVFAMGLYWLWDMKPSTAETEWLRSELKDLRSDLNAECAKRQRVEDRVLAIEKPPFEPKFGDMVMAEKADKSGMKRAVYMYTSNGGHRVAMDVDGVVNEYFTDTIEPLDD